MALADLIANSGAQNFETMRKGWLPTAAETNARRMSELQLQEKQQKIDYEPERQTYLKQKRKSELVTQEQQTKLFDERMKKYKTDQQIQDKDRRLSVMSNFTRGAFARFKETKDISVAQEIFRENYNALKEAGDDDQDKQLDRFLDPNTSKKEAETMLSGLNAVLPLAQKALDKQRASLSGSLYERLKLKKSMGDIDAEDQKKLDKLSGKMSSDQYEKTLTFKENKEYKKGMETMSKNYKKEFKPFIHTSNQITKIKNALKSGDNAAMDILVTGMLTNIEGSGIKAKSMFDIYNAPLGNIMERIRDEVSRFIGGVKTDAQKQQILTAVTELGKYNDLVLSDGKDKFRSMARKNKYDVGQTIPFETFEEVKQYVKDGYWKKEQAIDYLEQNKRLLRAK